MEWLIKRNWVLYIIPAMCVVKYILYYNFYDIINFSM